jgi:flagellin-like protein
MHHWSGTHPHDDNQPCRRKGRGIRDKSHHQNSHGYWWDCYLYRDCGEDGLALKFSRRRAVSPIIASLLLIAIAVAAGIIVYVYVNSLAGGLTSGGGSQVSAQIQLQAVNFLPQGYGGGTSTGQVVDAFIENTGSSSIAISNIYFDGSQLTEWGFKTGTTYGTNLYVGNSGQNCFALVPSSVTLTYSQTPTSDIAGLSAEGCGSYTGTVCNTVATDFCILSSATNPAETGMTASPLAAQGTAQLIIGLNHGAAVTAGSSHTIKIVTTSGTQAVFSVTAGRTG